MSIQLIEGGVCAPQGFSKSNIANDGSLGSGLSLIYSKKLANAAAILTSNKVKSSSLLVTKKNIENGRAQAIILTSDSANACTARGIESASEVASALGKALKISPKNVMISSSGEIGKTMNTAVIAEAIPTLAGGLTSEDLPSCEGECRECAVSFEIDGKLCRMGGVAPSAGETIAFITTDCAISSEMLSLALSADVQNTLDLVNSDGKSTPCDIVLALANGKAKNKEITKRGKDFAEFAKALNAINVILARKIAADCKGGTKLIECSIYGAKNEAAAKAIAKGIMSAPEVKAAIYSANPCWGLIISAIGASGVEVDPTKADISFISGKGEIPVCSGGIGVQFSEDFAKEILSEDELTIAVKLSDGVGEATSWGSDMSYDYIKYYSGEKK